MLLLLHSDSKGEFFHGCIGIQKGGLCPIRY